MEIGPLNIIELSYDIATFFLLSLIAGLLIKDKLPFFNFKKKISAQHGEKKKWIRKIKAPKQNFMKHQPLDTKPSRTIESCPYALVKKLANHGWSIEEIVKKVGLPYGEIELVIKFNT